jgi:hypothetical protein
VSVYGMEGKDEIQEMNWTGFGRHSYYSVGVLFQHLHGRREEIHESI